MGDRPCATRCLLFDLCISHVAYNTKQEESENADNVVAAHETSVTRIDSQAVAGDNWVRDFYQGILCQTIPILLYSLLATSVTQFVTSKISSRERRPIQRGKLGT